MINRVLFQVFKLKALTIKPCCLLWLAKRQLIQTQKEKPWVKQQKLLRNLLGCALYTVCCKIFALRGIDHQLSSLEKLSWLVLVSLSPNRPVDTGPWTYFSFLACPNKFCSPAEPDVAMPMKSSSLQRLTLDWRHSPAVSRDWHLS